jgi:hypothetical protein
MYTHNEIIDVPYDIFMTEFLYIRSVFTRRLEHRDLGSVSMQSIVFPLGIFVFCEISWSLVKFVTCITSFPLYDL